MIHRRDFLAALAALGTVPVWAQAPARGQRIDVHHHILPPEYVDVIAARRETRVPEWSPQRSLDELDGRAESSKSAHLRRLRYVIRQFFLQVLRRKHLTFIQPSDSVLNNLLSLVLFKVTNEPIVKRLTR